MIATREMASAGTARLPTYRRIIVPLDGSELSELALPHAEQLARLSGAQIIVLRCYTEPDPIEPTAALGATLGRSGFTKPGRPTGPPSPADEILIDAKAARDARNLRFRVEHYLDDVAEPLRSRGVQIGTV